MLLAGAVGGTKTNLTCFAVEGGRLKPVVADTFSSRAHASLDEIVRLFVSLYGAKASNLALTIMAAGGVFVGGGIAPKIIERLTDGTFMRAFTAKGRLKPVLEAMPVRVILNDKTALLGAARCAYLSMSGKDASEVG